MRHGWDSVKNGEGAAWLFTAPGGGNWVATGPY